MENEEDMLFLQTTATFGLSDRPWTATNIPVGSIVRFVKTIKPKSPGHNQCKYHGNGSNKCRHVVIEWEGMEIPTSVCMEDAARYYFKEANVEPESTSWP